MKHLLFIVAASFLMVACSEKKTNVDTLALESKNTTTDVYTSAYTLDSLLSNADNLIDQTVTVRGSVTHTCKHSGKRCFIVGEDPNISMRVEAKGEIGGFNRELVGSELAITGVVKERRLSKEYIDQHEKEVNEQAFKEDGSAETCAAELSNIEGMRAWMKANNKDYYAIYYMDGESYEVIEE
ncbi:hypothetical protein LJB98_01690 [Bacteroidales bacterium OttesenSCG-928-M11]|nr:hypothetical protein [Bacteroidales bacterium OttesenSCG-928-M11]